MERYSYLSKTARKKVITGRQFVVAAARVADVYTRATPLISKLKVILKFITRKSLRQQKTPLSIEFATSVAFILG